MLLIISHFRMISIPIRNTELAIYTTEYYIDEDGKVYEEMPHTNVYEYGDLIFETPSAKYIFSRIYWAFSFCADIIEKIQEQKDQEIITINLDGDFDAGNFRAEGGFHVIPKTFLTKASE